MGMISEFKEFAVKGNAMDMAVGIILGAATTAVVGSLVADILMPIIGLFTGGVDFTNLFANLGEGSYSTLAAAEEAGAVTLNYGRFIQAIIDFLMIAFVIFMIVRSINKMKKKAEEAPAEPDPNTVLLEEIRDALKK